MDTTIEALSTAQIAAEWRRRADRPGLARVMRASQPPELADGVTDTTRALVAGYLDAVAARLGRPIASVLEVGCGIGRITPTLAGRAERVVALDMTTGMLDAARATCAELPNVEFRHQHAQDLDGDDRFDVAVSIWVLMHVLDETELARVCAALRRQARHLLLIEYESAAVTVGRYSRLRPLAHYLELLPGAAVVEARDLLYGGDRSFAALIDLQA